MRDDHEEMSLWSALRQHVPPRVAGQRMGMDPSRVVEICERWAERGIYDYGVVVDLGWISHREIGATDKSLPSRVDNDSSHGGQ